MWTGPAMALEVCRVGSVPVGRCILGSTRLVLFCFGFPVCQLDPGSGALRRTGMRQRERCLNNNSIRSERRAATKFIITKFE